MSGLLIRDLEESRDPHLGLTLVAGRKGLGKRIGRSQVQKMGLALTGFTRFVDPQRLQIIGNTELAFFKTLMDDQQKDVIQKICSVDIACIVITRNLDIPERLLQESEEKGIPLFRTSLRSIDFIEQITQFLEERLAPATSIHGVLMDVFGVGILILGKSGIGKSECALDLILRGHRLIADDMVSIQRRLPATLLGSGFDVIQHHMEIRGLGIINIRHLFGIEAIRERKRIELVIELVAWDDQTDYDRVGLEEENYSLLGVDLPLLKIPVTPGRNLSTIIEVAARNYLLKRMGLNSALEFEGKLLRKIQESKRGAQFVVKDEVE
jgi:HPr kinase/phosphorylase